MDGEGLGKVSTYLVMYRPGMTSLICIFSVELKRARSSGDSWSISRSQSLKKEGGTAMIG
jgi:hypothetical protein